MPLTLKYPFSENWLQLMHINEQFLNCFFFLSVFFHVFKENVKDNTLSVLTMPVLFNDVLFYDYIKINQ